jgi:hypothetical protein
MRAFDMDKETRFDGGGLVLFAAVRDALEARKILREGGYAARLVAPPPQLRRGCDLAVEINLVEKPGIERLLNERKTPFSAVEPLRVAAAELLNVVRATDFGKWLMVKAGNMKLTFDKETGEIVNTSGGGCPDIPYLYAALVGMTLETAPRPRDIGFTLCGLMLDHALEESLRLWLKEGGDVRC